jgi:hypothetical protein
VTPPSIQTPLDPPDEFDRSQASLRRAAEDRLWDLLWWWMMANGIFLGGLCLGACLGSAVFAAAGVLWLGSVAAAGAVGIVTYSNWSVLKRRWRIAGLLPWVVLVIEATFLAVAYLS